MRFWILIIALSIVSCNKVELDGVVYKEFSIDKHKSTYDVEKISSHKIEGLAKFSSSCEYLLTENIGQINKLIGLSVGLDHHENSIRIGWEFDQGVFKLYAYWYADGVRDQEYLTSVVTDEKFEFTVEITDTQFYVKVNESEFITEHGIDKVDDTFMLYPYFGGEAEFPGSIHGDKKCKIYIHLL